MKTNKLKGGNMKMNKVLLGIMVVSVVFVLTFGFASAFGFGFGNVNHMNFENLSVSDRVALEEKRNATLTAIENNDYEAWKTIMESDLTRENFDKLVEQHKEMSQFQNLRQQLRQAYQNGNTTEVSQIQNQLSDLGFNNETGIGMRFGGGQGMMMGNSDFSGQFHRRG